MVQRLRLPVWALAICISLLTELAGAQASPAAPLATAAAVPSENCGSQNLLLGKAPVQAQGIGGEATRLTDGKIGQEGAPWDSPAAATFQASGSVTYDLGATVAVSALYLQADANDVYRILGATEASGGFRPLAAAPNVVQRGHGLRFRALELEAAPVRYLRVQMGRGDGNGSVAELAAYCSRPAVFPPELETIGLPPFDSEAHDAAARELERRNRNVLFGLAAVLALFGFMQSAQRSKRVSSSSATGGVAATSAATPAAGAPSAEPHAAAPSVPPAAAARRREGYLLLMFLASGCAALIYEVVWLHLLRLVIGASALSVGIVLASFMGGMFLGSLYLARLVPRRHDPLKVYGWLELGIGVFGLLMPLLLPAVRSVYVGLVGYGPLGIALRALIAALLLLPPTALMGATLPAIARRYSNRRKDMSRLAALYSANTLGAVLGSLLSGFYLMAVWNIWVATLAAAILNFAVAAAALWLARSSPEAAASLGTAPAGGSSAAQARVSLVYLAVGLSGLSALGAQVLWTRLLTLLFGATVYAFAIILAVFLGGLGLGSAFAAYRLRRGLSGLVGLAWSQLGLVPALLLSGRLLANVLPYASPSATTPVAALHALHVLHAAFVILPAAMLWGMSFPFALAAAGAGHTDTGRSSGHVYAANTVGAILGALVVSFLVIPAWGTHAAARLLVVVGALSAAAGFYALARRRQESQPASTARAGRELLLEPAWVVAAGLGAAALLPGLSQVFLAHGRYVWAADPRDQYPYVSEGAASTVAVHIAPDGYRNFHVSGRVEASNNPTDLRTERLIGHLSALAHPHPESVLVVGLGAGVSAGSVGLHPEVRRIVICEIEPRVVGAARQFSPENYAILDDPRVEIVFDDARHFLATTKESFDVITSDPIHPWVRGNSMLFSREYYAIVKSRLKPGGIATQWVPLYETSEAAIRIQMATFLDAFPSGSVWNTVQNNRGYDVVLVGGSQPPKFDLANIDRRLRDTQRVAESLREVRIPSALELVATYGTHGPDMQKWLTGTPINNDFSLKLEYISGLSLNRIEADPIYAHMIAERTYPESIIVASPAQHAELRRRLFPEALSQLER